MTRSRMNFRSSDGPAVTLAYVLIAGLPAVFWSFAAIAAARVMGWELTGSTIVALAAAAAVGSVLSLKLVSVNGVEEPGFFDAPLETAASRSGLQTGASEALAPSGAGYAPIDPWDWKSGDWKSGEWKSGDWKSADWRAGDWRAEHTRRPFDQQRPNVQPFQVVRGAPADADKTPAPT